MEQPPLKNILEAILLAAAKPMSVNQLMALLADRPLEEDASADEEPGGEAHEAAEEARAARAAKYGAPERGAIREALAELTEDFAGRGFELKEVASGFRIQVREGYAQWVSRLWDERPPRYSRALLETLALIAYRQPITRAEIEDIRGVAVSSNIVKTLLEREWVRVVGHKELPGRPAMYATTRQFLDYFNLKSLAELPTLSELRDLEQISAELVEQGVIEAETAGAASETGASDGNADSPAAAAVESAEGEGMAREDSAEPEASPEDTAPVSDESDEVDESLLADEALDADDAMVEAEAATDESEQTKADEPMDAPMDDSAAVDPSEEGASDE